MEDKTKEILQKQLELLSEHSQNCGVGALCDLTNAMVGVAKVLDTLQTF